MTLVRVWGLMATLSMAAWAYTASLKWSGKNVIPRGGKTPAPWGVLDAAMVFFLFLFMSIAPMAVLAAIMHVTHTQMPKDVAIPLGMLLIYVSNAVTILVMFLVAARDMHPLRALGFGERPLWPSLRTAALLFFAFLPLQYGWQIGLSSAWQWVFKEAPPQEDVVKLLASASGLTMAVLTVVAVVMAPVLEELVFRGFIQRGLENRFGTRVAIVATALLFSRLHGGTAVTLVLLPLALALGVLYARTRNILVVIAFHMGFNGVNIALVLAARASGVDLTSGVP